jgi:serine/threonine protein kinase
MRLLPEITPGMMLPARLPPGFVLGDLVVDGWVRDGGSAAIYRAHRSDGRRAAVKLQLPTTVRDPILGERFEREAELLWRLRGTAHVVELLDVGMLDDGRRYLVLEWMDGGDLDDLLELACERDQLLPVLRACRIARDVARGLAALHERGVVHLDVEAPNVMLGRDEHGADRVALVDFAAAADLRDLATFEDVVPGTPYELPSHVSPQRARGGAPSKSCDVFALGVLMFEALSGACAPPEGWPLETLPRLDALRHGVPPALAELVRMCMSREIERRPTSARVVAAVLDAIVGALEAGEDIGKELGRSGTHDAVRRPEQAASTPEDDAETGEGRTGDTLLGIPVRFPVVRAEPSRPPDEHQAAVAPRVAAASHSPVGSSDPEVAMWTRLTAANQPPPPAPQPGDTEVAMRLPPTMTVEGATSAQPGDTVVATRLPLAVSDPSLRPEDTWELVPAVHEPPVDPDDTEVAMRLPPDEPTDEPSPEDTAATLELGPKDGSQALLAPGPQDSVADGVRYEEQDDSRSSELEWLAQEQRWWVRWAVAAGVLVVAGGSGAWLVTRAAGDEASAASTSTTDAGEAVKQAIEAAAAVASVANAATSDRPPASSHGDGWGSTHERARMEARADDGPATPEASDASHEAADRGEAIVESKPSRKPKAGSPAAAIDDPACQEARARADAGKRERAWETVLEATRQRGCWRSSGLRVARARLRVTAYAELGELERCVEEGAKSRDREVAARSALCRKKLDGEV